MRFELDAVERDITAIRLPRWGRVAQTVGVVSWLVIDPDGVPVVPVRRFLRDFTARNRPGSVRSYAYGLLRWWRWLQAVDVHWDKATSVEVRDLVLWLGQADKLRNAPRTGSAVTAGTINPVTRKRHLDDGYEPRTVRHSNAVIRSFYEFWIESGDGPLVNPVPLDCSVETGELRLRRAGHPPGADLGGATIRAGQTPDRGSDQARHAPGG